MPYRKILCPIDFSETSHAAMRAAIDLAKAESASLTLVHVYQAPVVDFPGYIADARVLAEVASAAETALSKWKHEAVQAGAPGVDTAAAMGVPWDHIVRMAKDGHYELIVIGTHGRTGLRHVLVGSVAEKVVRHAHCPVLVVRPRAI